MKEFLLVSFVMLFVISAAMFWTLVLGGRYHLSKCAKQHNVYACEYVAVPKKEGAE